MSTEEELHQKSTKEELQQQSTEEELQQKSLKNYTKSQQKSYNKSEHMKSCLDVTYFH